MNLYSYTAADAIIDRYINRGGEVYTLPGSLVDNHIITAPGFKSYIIKEVYLNCYSSAVSIRRYNKLPAKYAAVIEAIEEGNEERAQELFFK